MESHDQIRLCATRIQALSREGSWEAVRVLLRDLDGSKVTMDHLQATDVVKVLYGVLKTSGSSAPAKKIIKAILSKWKRQYSQSYEDAALSPGDAVAPQRLVAGADSEGSAPLTDSQQRCPSGDRMLSPTLGSPHGAPSESTLPTSTPEDARQASGDFPAVRSKCLRLLLAALISQGPPASSREEDERLAGDLEHHIHALHAGSPPRYKARVRSRVANLRNPGSAHLRRGLLDGSLAPRDLARMSAEEMAGEDLRRRRREYAAQALSECRLPRAPEGTPTRKLRCRRCGASDCRVSQVSRGVLFLPGWAKPGGPDHDAVTFVTCGDCGEQWYHSGWVCL
ncbi:hypothetical protein NHX12_014729 [Muraenolepis orangiensis]|uniref:Transcription elongation factor A N-terminal and central domain-containing protein n=1 Tax=Muraenolepis orangiensis TaxID=630683 RepID=A0A9Q0I429_9TELE|nr:hypothetical protein NHX12_014729 [Muraenolepis orangiensis]